MALLLPVARFVTSHPPLVLASSSLISYTNKGEPDKAIADLTEAIRLEPKNASAYRTRRVNHSKKSEPEMAITDFNEAIRLDPKFAEAYFSLGIVYSENGETDKAIIDYNDAIRLDPVKPHFYILRAAEYLKKLGDEAKAASDERKFEELTGKKL